MEGRLLFKDCTVVRTDGRARGGLAAVVEGSLVTRVLPDAEAPVLPGDWAVPCRGRALLPGRVDCHAQLVNGLLRPASAPAHAWAEPLEQRRARDEALAQTLTASEVEPLALFAVARALCEGVTCVAEQLRCPNAVEGALRAEARAAERVGLRLILSHAAMEAGGASPSEAQVEENLAFARAGPGPALRVALGFQAPWGLSEPLLRRLGQAASELDCAVHGQLAESDEDLERHFARFGARVVTRLSALGLLSPRLLAADGQLLDQAECRLLEQSGALLAWIPGPEFTPAEKLQALVAGDLRLGLGSGWEGTASSQALVRAQAVTLARAGRLLDPDALLTRMLLSGPAELAGRAFGARVGEVEEGMLADLVLHDFVPPEGPEAAPGALWSARRSPAAWVVVDGRVVVREGQLLGADLPELAREAARVLSARARARG